MGVLKEFLDTPALDITGALRIPNLSGFVGIGKDRVRCLVCGKRGPSEDVWVFVCLAGHPAKCQFKGCTAVFARDATLSQHMTTKHPKHFPKIEGETQRERVTRLRRERKMQIAAQLEAEHEDHDKEEEAA